MHERLLQLNFSFNVSAEEYHAAVALLAEEFAAVPGLRWKIWLLNDSEKHAGGLYLFENQDALQTFVESDLAAGVLNHPALRNISVKTFDVIDDLTAITRGPVEVDLRA